MIEPVLSTFALWTPAGVSINALPEATGEGTALKPWPDAPLLSAIHPRARRPHLLAVALVQLSHALLQARQELKDAPFFDVQQVDLLLGTATGSAAADFEFWSGTQDRGAAFGSPSTFVYTLATSAGAEITLALGLRGSLATLSAGAASGLAAIARAASRISKGRARACLCGGVEFTSAGHRGVSGLVEQEVIALFLVEAGPSSMPWPSVCEWHSGFSPERPSARAVEASPLSTLSALGRAAVRLGASPGVEHLFASSSDGHWARISLASPQQIAKQSQTRSQ